MTTLGDQGRNSEWEGQRLIKVKESKDIGETEEEYAVAKSDVDHPQSDALV